MPSNPNMELLKKAYQQMKTNGDEGQAEKLQQVIAKRQSNQVYFAFCGHFSAGKSSLINRLCSRAVLPASPIPTSANIVHIHHGEPQAVVTYRAIPDKLQLNTPIQQTIALDELESYCTNGTEIAQVDVSISIPWLGTDGVLMDTPGIDSTDDAHQEATQSILHLADVVFYVMDYHYVQSEMNFSFVKQMNDWGKPVYLIINMIDKHKEQEIPFTQFRQVTEEAFLAYGLHVVDYFYISTLVPDHPLNDWHALQPLIQQLIIDRQRLLDYSATATFSHLVNAHMQWIADSLEPQRIIFQQIMSEKAEENWQEAANTLQQRIEVLHREADQFELDLRRELLRTIENANITPALTRDQAHIFLEAARPGFRVGLFARATQTQAEYTRRLQLFRDDFYEQVKSQLIWHIQAMYKKEYQQWQFTSPLLEKKIDQFDFDVTTDWLSSFVHPGAEWSGTYTLQYMREVGEACKLAIRRIGFEFIEDMKWQLHEKNQQDIRLAEQQLAVYSDCLEAQKQLNHLEEQEKAQNQPFTVWLSELHIEAYTSLSLPKVHRNLLETKEEKQENSEASSQLQVASDEIPTRVSSNQQAVSEMTAGESIKRVKAKNKQFEDKSKQLLDVASWIEEIPGLKSNCTALRQKAKGLVERTFTIAMFGAFSSGKSSFINALIGKKVLPVSPHPFTATIHRIRWPEVDELDGTAKVKMKTAEALFLDVQYSLRMLGSEVHSMSQALLQISKLDLKRIPSKSKAHYTFLQAVQAGWNEAQSLLGTELRITHEQFATYVANERMSCYVESVDSYDCNPWTEQGIQFVDTPGADSIYARHTQVAFTYIKQADAIFFVTYFNHAFSQADREFLIQLGRVKDNFEMDKMFFMINAIDLATHPSEIELVTKNVEKNLLHHGIRFPRIYPLSSFEALEGKLQSNALLLQKSKLIPFEQDFVTFSFEELQEMALYRAELEMRQALSALDQRILFAQSDSMQRQQQKQIWEQTYQQALQIMQGTHRSRLVDELKIEIEELGYYVRQRTTYRYGEWMQMAFHPSTFRELADFPKQALLLGWEELKQYIRSHLEQEMLAMTLRIENKIKALLKQTLQSWRKEFGEIFALLIHTVLDIPPIATPSLVKQFEVPAVSEKSLTRYFKSAKQFFEENGRSQLREYLESELNPAVTTWVTQQVAELILDYENKFLNLLQIEETDLTQRMEEQYLAMLDVLSQQIDRNQLEDLRKRIEQYISVDSKDFS